MSIELKYLPAFSRSNSECHADALDAAYSYWSVGRAPALDHDPTFQRVVGFDLEDPLVPDNIVLRRN